MASFSASEAVGATRRKAQAAVCHPPAVAPAPAPAPVTHRPTSSAPASAAPPAAPAAANKRRIVPVPLSLNINQTAAAAPPSAAIDLTGDEPNQQLDGEAGDVKMEEEEGSRLQGGGGEKATTDHPDGDQAMAGRPRDEEDGADDPPAKQPRLSIAALAAKAGRGA